MRTRPPERVRSSERLTLRWIVSASPRSARDCPELLRIMPQPQPAQQQPPTHTQAAQPQAVSGGAQPHTARQSACVARLTASQKPYPECHSKCRRDGSQALPLADNHHRDCRYLFQAQLAGVARRG